MYMYMYMYNKLGLLENFQQNQNKNLVQEQNQDPNKPFAYIDGTYVILNRSIKFLLNFLLTFIFLQIIIGNFPDLNINQFILVVCTVSSVLLYILDLAYPSCYI